MAFAKIFGALEMAEARAEHVLGFINRKPVSNSTWRMKYFVLTRFFEHWANRGVEVSFVMPPPKSISIQTFIPYVFTSSDLRTLLETIAQSAKRPRRIDRLTLRTAVLFLYGTGASTGELQFVRYSDLDLTSGHVEIRSTRPSRARRIPIGSDLRGVLETYMAAHSHVLDDDPLLFVTTLGLPITSSRMLNSFRRVCRAAGICRRDGSRYQPRVDDLRYSFAVQRITSWIDEGIDLNRMLPALAAYMGQIGLGSTERYLFLTPERFRKDLDKLSPVHGRGRWCNDHELLTFLAGL